MSDNETGPVAGPNKAVIALLGVVVVLLVVIVAIVLLQKPAATPVAGNNTPPASTDTSVPAGMGAGAPTAFDPATATKLAEGETPQAFVEAYFKELVAGDYEKAYNRLPAAKKTAQDAAGFAEQLKGYGITDYKMGATTTSGEDTVVSGSAITSAGTFEYIWTFTKLDGKWVVKGRELGGMGQ